MSRKQNGWKACGKAALGLLVGIGLVEAIFSFRDAGAFPHLNLYMADAELGARLEPESSMHLKFGDNPKTTVRINAEGYRGQAWGEKSGPEILIVGDSQVFGLGVQEDETFARRLEAHLEGKTRVLNAGVPTYGPGEYHAVIKEVGGKRKPETVVMVLNMANDLFEAKRPNIERHIVWDGWAVRKESAPDEVFDFPGRHFLFSKSHAVFALRRYLHDKDPNQNQLNHTHLPSEGVFSDLVESGGTALEKRARAKKESLEAYRKFLKEAELTKNKVAETDDRAISKLVKLGGDNWIELGGGNAIPTETHLRAGKANPGDIVGLINYGEASGPYSATTQAIQRGAAYRRYLEEVARKRAQASAHARATVQTLEELKALKKQLAELRALPPLRSESWSPLRAQLAETKALVESWGGRFLVVVLPLDVQVSEAEWKKYEDKVEMSSTLILNEDLIKTAKALQLNSLDALPVLASASPGAFLRGDLHMTPKGHEALALSLVGLLEAPAPLPIPAPGLPAGRSLPPQLLHLHVEAPVKGSTKAGCKTFYEDDWFHMRCQATQKTSPLSIIALAGGLGDVALARQGKTVSLLTPLIPGEQFEARVIYPEGQRKLLLTWKGASAAMSIGELEPLEQKSSLPPELKATSPLCKCAQSVERTWEKGRLIQREKDYEAQDDGWGDGVTKNPPLECIELVFEPRSDCETTYPNDCEAMLACAQGDPWFAPDCPEGTSSAGALGRCLSLCNEATPCSTGSCREWQGAQLCFAGP